MSDSRYDKGGVPRKVQDMYRELDAFRRRHPPKDFQRDELEVALINDSKRKFKDKRVKDYYSKQNNFVKELLDVHRWTEVSKKKRLRGKGSKDEADLETKMTFDEEARNGGNEEEIDESSVTRFAVNVSFMANVILFIMKLAAFVMSGSLAVLASLLDSFLDLASGFILFCTMRAVSNAAHDSFKFPVGKNRLEPLGVMIFAVVMGISMLLLARETVTALVVGFTSSGDSEIPNFGTVVVAVVVSTVVIKSVLYVYCSGVARATGSSAVETYAEDHRNDILTNICGLAGGLVASSFPSLWWMDPLVALLLALFVAYNWLGAAHEQLWLLVGVTASPELLNKLTLMAHNHDPRIEKVDTVRAYHAGSRLLAEVHIVMRPETPLHISHDVGEALENDIEHYFKADIERAFVHIDYEWSHMPRDEHSTNPVNERSWNASGPTTTEHEMEKRDGADCGSKRSGAVVLPLQELRST